MRVFFPTVATELRPLLDHHLLGQACGRIDPEGRQDLAGRLRESILHRTVSVYRSGVVGSTMLGEAEPIQERAYLLPVEATANTQRNVTSGRPGLRANEVEEVEGIT